MNEIKELQEQINKALGQLNLPNSPSNLYEPIRYVLHLGGKRVRPMLALLAYRLYKNDIEQAILPSLALELFHNFTLVHDDIMDEAPLRRGKETVHKKWNQNIAILSGDVMLVKAYELLSNAPKETLPHLLSKFNTCAREVCEGQQKDMDFELRPYISVEEYLDMIRQKTAVLLGFSLEMGGILAGASQKDCETLYEVGINLGLAFQLQDDLLDLYGGESFGKQLGGDVINKKKSYLITKALEITNDKNNLLKLYNSKSDVRNQKIQKVKSIFEDLSIQTKAMEEIISFKNHGLSLLEKVKTPLNKSLIKLFFENLNNRIS